MLILLKLHDEYLIIVLYSIKEEIKGGENDCFEYLKRLHRGNSVQSNENKWPDPDIRLAYSSKSVLLRPLVTEVGIGLPPSELNTSRKIVLEGREVQWRCSGLAYSWLCSAVTPGSAQGTICRTAGRSGVDPLFPYSLYYYCFGLSLEKLLNPLG